MIKYTLLLFMFLVLFFSSHSQSYTSLDFNNEYKSDYVFDYFRQLNDSAVWFVGSRVVVEYNRDLFKGKDKYDIRIGDSTEGEMNVYFDDKLLYKYYISNGGINGLGYVYYLKTSCVAIQGNFKNGLLDGLVIVQNEKGKVLRIMVYKRGKYKKHIFSFLTSNKKELKKMSKNRSHNPLRDDEIITM